MDNLRLLALKDSEGRGCGVETIQRIERPTRADTQSVNEEKKHGHKRDE
jgi:hypothetical protein